jgi:hypothetical protein
MKKQSIFEQFAKGLGDAVADIREKVVEEPWYGRALSQPHTIEGWPQARAAQPEVGEHDCAVDIDMDR